MINSEFDYILKKQWIVKLDRIQVPAEIKQPPNCEQKNA